MRDFAAFGEVNDLWQIVIGELLACRTEGRPRRLGNGLPCLWRDRGEVVHSITKDTLGPAMSAEYSGESSRLGRLVAHSKQAAIDDWRRAAPTA